NLRQDLLAGKLWLTAGLRLALESNVQRAERRPREQRDFLEVAIVELGSRFVGVVLGGIRHRDDESRRQLRRQLRQLGLYRGLENVWKDRRVPIAVAEIKPKRQPRSNVDAEVSIEATLHQVQ